MSAVVTTLIIILLAIVAIGIVWVVVKNIIDKGSDEITLTGLTLDLDITKVTVDGDILSVTVKRNAGEGDLVGINFVISDGDNSVVVRKDTTLAELGFETFTFDLTTLAVGEITSISIAPIFEVSSGTETIGGIIDTTTSDSGDLGTGDEGYVGDPGGDPSCTPECEGLDCGDDGCSGSCGDCNVGFSCGEDNMCYDDTCVAEDPAVTCTGFNCGNVTNNCGEAVNCSIVAEGTCAELFEATWECVENVCTEITYVEGGLIDNVWPPGAGIYFDDAELTKTDSIYYGYSVAFSGYDTECYLIVGYSYDEAVYENAIVEMFLQQPLENLQIGDTYEIWDQIGDCTNALPVGA